VTYTGFEVTLDAINDGADTIRNTATVEGISAGEPVTDTDHHDLTVLSPRSVEIVKSGPESAAPGEPVDYRFEITNTGSLPVTDLRLDDTILGEGILAAQLDGVELAPGGSTTVTYTGYVVNLGDLTDPATLTIRNVVTVTGDSGGETVTDDDHHDLVVVGSPSITVDKTASPRTVVNPTVGTEVTYTFTITNTGDLPLELGLEDVFWTGSSRTDERDRLDLSAQLPQTTLAPAGQISVPLTYAITAADIAAGGVFNTAFVTGTPPAGPPVTDEDDETVTVPLPPPLRASIELTKTHDDTGFPATQIVGDEVVYEFEVRNSGPVTLHSVHIVDPLLGLTGGTSVLRVAPGTLAPGEVGTATGTYTLEQADLDRGEVYNLATATGTDPFGNPVSADDDETVGLTPVLGEAPVIRLVKSHDAAALGATQTEGDEITYLFEVRNPGTVPLTDVHITDALLGYDDERRLAVTPSTLEPGGVGYATATYPITTEDLAEGEVHNVATVVGTAPDGSRVIHTDDERVGLTPVLGEEIAPAISLVKSSAVSADARVGDRITYNFDVTNVGDVVLTNVRVTDPLLGEGTLAVEPSTLEPGETGRATATYTVTEADMSRGYVYNTALGRGTPPQGPDVTDEDDVTTPLPTVVQPGEVPERPTPPVTRQVRPPMPIGLAQTGLGAVLQLLVLALGATGLGGLLVRRTRAPKAPTARRGWSIRL
jgi:uncharacterized repeat protein (TIGR01451 family)